MPLFLDRRVYRRSFHSTGAHSKVDKVLYMKEQSEAHTTGGFVVTFIAARHILISSRATHGKFQAPPHYNQRKNHVYSLHKQQEEATTSYATSQSGITWQHKEIIIERGVMSRSNSVLSRSHLMHRFDENLTL